MLYSATWGHLTRCCQFDDGIQQLAETTYKDALEKHGCLDMEVLQFLEWIASAANTDVAQVMMDTQHLIRIQLNNEQKWATVVGIRRANWLICKPNTAKHF